MRALVYTRISQDRAEGRSVSEQEADARTMCEREGWTIAEVVTDSVGASRRSKGRRTGWERATELLEAGDIDVLVTWEASRAQRDLTAYAELRDLCARTDTLWAYSGRVHDLSEGHDRFTTGLDALIAEREAEEMVPRILRAVRANALQGKPHGRRLFGYRRIYESDTGRLLGQEPDPIEAPVVQRIFRDYLSGLGSRSIARNLNADGITTGTGSHWRDQQVWRVLQNPAYTARRVHQGEVIGDADWPALVSADDFDRVQAIRATAAAGRHRTSKVSRLLSGVARCGVCFAKMGVGHDRKRRKVYQCRSNFCVVRDEAKLDEYVTVALLARIEAAEVPPGAEEPSELVEMREGVETLRKRLHDATAEFTAGRLTAGTLARIEADLLAQIELLERRIRRLVLPVDLELPAGSVEEWWEGLTREVRRAYVGAFIDSVVVSPTLRGTRRFDPDAVAIEWRV